MKKVFNNPIAVASAYTVSIIIASLLFSHLEEARSFGDGLWWAFITSLTIGYGDLYPVTVAGRIMAIGFSIFWIFLILPCVIAQVLAMILEDRDAFTHAEQEWQEHALKEIASKLNIELPPPPKDW